MTRKVLAAVLLSASLSQAGELVIHDRPTPDAPEEREAVVTLLDPDSDDPAEYRWVLVNARTLDFSILFNREDGSVFACVGKVQPWKTKDPSKPCAKVFDGPVVK